MAAMDGHSDWRPLAECQSKDTELFFPISLSGPGAAQVEQAKAICAKCSVRSHCLSTALALDHVEGIWGGTTEKERRRRREVGSCQPNRWSPAARHAFATLARIQRPASWRARPSPPRALGFIPQAA
jgi:WhiB family redox-sensing transcriptional regulator